MRRLIASAALTLIVSSAILLAQGAAPAPTKARSAAFTVSNASIGDLRAALAAGRTTSRAIVTEYLTRIAYYEDLLHATLTVNRHALAEADERDRERRAGRIRGPLHGIPVAVKDNIHTTTMPTTGGALAFAGFTPPYEATVTKRLRDAGAIILAKTTMTELANWVAGAPTPMPGNYNAVGSFGMNPYDPRRDPRPATFDGRPVMNTGGSSSGIGTAVSFWAANVGTETSGSILSPANQNMLVGIKPTVGRVSRYGVIPITGDQDTPGPLARTVRDAAILLGALEGASPDPHDPATSACQAPPGRDYTRFLRTDALRGARIGIPRAFYIDALPGSGDEPRGGLNPAQKAAVNDAIEALLRTSTQGREPDPERAIEEMRARMRRAYKESIDNSAGKANDSRHYARFLEHEYAIEISGDMPGVEYKVKAPATSPVTPLAIQNDLGVTSRPARSWTSMARQVASSSACSSSGGAMRHSSGARTRAGARPRSASLSMSQPGWT